MERKFGCLEALPGVKGLYSASRATPFRYSYEMLEHGFKFILYRPQHKSDIYDVTLNGTEMSVLAILRQKPDSSRNEIADKISKTVRTVQRALDSLREKGYIQRIGSKRNASWEVLK